MPATLNTPFVDTRADELVWTLARPELPALLTRTHELGGCRVTLRVLGASHQVVLDTGSTPLTETVACLSGLAGDLPERARRDVTGLASYTFASSVAVLPPDAFTERVERIRGAVDRDPRGLVAAFPGTPDAVTALLPEAAGPRGVRWRTWHAYPQTGELVTTTTTCERGHPPGKDS